MCEIKKGYGVSWVSGGKRKEGIVTELQPVTHTARIVDEHGDIHIISIDAVTVSRPVKQ